MSIEGQTLSIDPKLMAAQLSALTAALSVVVASRPEWMAEVMGMALQTPDKLLPSALSDEQIRCVQGVFEMVALPPVALRAYRGWAKESPAQAGEMQE